MEVGYAWSLVLGSSSGSFEGGSMIDSTEFRNEEYKCNCGLNAIIRTSFTFQNMGKRFRCCPKKKDPYNYFHFLASEEKIEGRVMELLLVLKDKECKVVKEKEKIIKCAIEETQWING
ncbi:hypothetical protein SLEP1_g15078 [Rubroshorea leprosula]|uniref:Zinc finger GRF-type domain-containing protein n=1 Tax=Rubroshorea leprosula TaxID=152421 RepID=A0AAV5IQK3_9ROSI|nr:hypothetical protein SLEP1_g15078 [Rubroshorea leprosula]